MNMHTPPRSNGSGKGAGRRKSARTPKGRQVEPSALAEIQALLTDRPRRRDLLIEHLHLIQDRYGHLSDRHLVALAQEMHLAMTEVYEVATFYHQFDVVKDGDPSKLDAKTREAASNQLRQGVGNEAVHGFVESLRKNAKIEVAEDRM